MVCQQCGEPLVAGAKYCHSCGQPLVVSHDVPRQDTDQVDGDTPNALNGPTKSNSSLEQLIRWLAYCLGGMIGGVFVFLGI